jgi:hypothetical protein
MRAALRLCVCVVATANAACTRPSVGIDPIAGILDAFRTHQIVAMGEGMHGNVQAHAFRLSLVRDPRFASVVNDIVVEFGSARYQAQMDRFIRGDDVPYAELRGAWQDTTNPSPIWDAPIYEEFFRVVRRVNASLPSDRQLRVLLGDPPIDWDAVHTVDEHQRWIGRRDSHAADLINRDVLSKNRRALLIYGDGHFLRPHKVVGSLGRNDRNVLNLIERQGIRVFSIWTNTTVDMEFMQRDIRSWTFPSLTIVRGTRLGKLDFKYFSGMDFEPPMTMEQQFDSVLYLGPVKSITISAAPRALCADPGYVKMRLTRLAVGPEAGVDMFKQECHIEELK